MVFIFCNCRYGVEHRFCVRHLYNNFRKRFPAQNLKQIMWRAALATYPKEWQRQMKAMRAANEEAYKWLEKIPPKFWTKSHVGFNSKCDSVLNNMSETFNSVIVGPREKPIRTMLEEIREYLMDRWTENYKKVMLFKDDVLPKIQKRLDKEKKATTCWVPSKQKLIGVESKNDQSVDEGDNKTE